MSAIRPYPPLAAPSPAARAVEPASARAAQRAFFQAALGGTAVVPAPVSAPAPVARTISAPTEEPARPLRPGSLVDIRV